MRISQEQSVSAGQIIKFKILQDDYEKEFSLRLVICTKGYNVQTIIEEIKKHLQKGFKKG